jgi:PAS domain S-box-containing protein
MAQRKPARVLYIEDDAGLTRLVGKKLTREGYVVDVAGDGGVGLAKLDKDFYDVLLLDYKIPVRDGLDVIRVLAREGRLPPTIVVTGAGDEDVAAEAMKLGASDYVVKDAEGKYLGLLPLVINQVLSRSILAREKIRAEEELRKSEEKYRTLAENIPIGLYRTEARNGGTVVSANRASARMFGYERASELIGKRAIDHYADPRDRSSLIEKVKAQGSVVNYEIQLKRRDGSEFWGSVSARAVAGADGVIAYLDGAIGDFTEHKRAQEALRDSEERYQALFDRSLDCVYIHDFKGNFLDANAAALKLLGYRKDELRSLNFTALLSPEQAKSALAAADEIKETGFQSDLMEFKLRRNDGRYVNVETKASVIFRDGEPYAIQGIARDITARKLTEERLRIARDELEERVKERTVELTDTLEKFSESEEKYRDVVERIQDGLAIVQDSVLKFFNRKLAETLGYEPADLRGRLFTDVVAPDERDRIMGYYRQRLEGEKVPSVYETIGVTRDGREIPVEVSVTVLQFEGQPAQLVLIRDLTERREQERVLREQQWILENVLNNMSEIVYVVDPYTREILYTNETGERLLGGRLAGQLCYRAIWGLEAACYSCRVGRVLVDGDGETYTREAFNEKLGRWLRVNMRAVPWRDGGQVWCGVAVDISESKALEEEIIAHNRTLNQTVKDRTAALLAKNRELESFTYSVSHDLRAPLRSIEGFSRALLEDYHEKLDDEGRDFLGRIVSSAVRMDRLINDLLSYSRLGQRGVASEAVDMNKLVAYALEEMKGDVEAAAAQVEVSGALPTVRGDPALLLVLLNNLIGNALKYRRPGVPPEVRITCREEEKKFVFAVDDNGIGLDMKYQNIVFQIFQRLHTEDDYPGTGIGLASARKVAAAHGGRIWYESEPGKGATFFFEISRRGQDDGGGGAS